MSNTLNTPIEALERDYPLRIERYALRRAHGRRRPHRGGDGVVRVYRVLADCRLGLMTERRRHGPPRRRRRRPGRPGRNLLNGRRLPAKCSLDLRAGDVLEIRTPGGGGWGEKSVPGTDLSAGCNRCGQGSTLYGRSVPLEAWRTVAPPVRKPKPRTSATRAPAPAGRGS